MQDKRTIGIAAAIFFFALALRLIGIGWGLKNDLHNQSYHPDEPVIFAYSQSIEPVKLKFTPGFYNYGTLYLTILKVSSDMTAAYTGGQGDNNDDAYWSFVSRAHVAGRILSALAGAATAVVLFFIGLRFYGLFGGVASGLAIAVSSAHSVHSRFQTVDILATFFLAASTLFALRLLTQKEPKDLTRSAILCGVFAGLSAGTKYTGILALLTLFVVLEVLRRRKDVAPAIVGKTLAAGILSALAVFIVTTPGILLDTEKFMTDFKYEMVHTATGHGLLFADTSSGFIYHLGNLFTGMGLLIGGIGIAGLVAAAIKKQWWAVAMLAFFVPYYFLIGRAEVKFLRYTFPLYVGVAAGFGYVIAESQKQESRRKLGVVFGILAIGGIDTGGLLGAAKTTAWMAMEDPRDSAARVLKKEERPTVGYAKDPWTWSVPAFRDASLPRMPMGPLYLRTLLSYAELVDVPPGTPNVAFLSRMQIMNAEGKGALSYFFEPAGAEMPIDPKLVKQRDFDPRLLDLKPDYIPLTSLESGYLERLRQGKSTNAEVNQAVGEYNAFRSRLEQEYEVVARFGAEAPAVEDMLYIQPQVLLWKRKAGS